MERRAGAAGPPGPLDLLTERALVSVVAPAQTVQRSDRWMWPASVARPHRIRRASHAPRSLARRRARAAQHVEALLASGGPKNALHPVSRISLHFGQVADPTCGPSLRQGANYLHFCKACFVREGWRRGRDLNPRWVAPYRISSAAP